MIRRIGQMASSEPSPINRSTEASPVLSVTGMHRSGTSLTAGWLAGCGLPLADGRLLGPSVENPTGHYEDLEFVDLHQSAIRSVDEGSHGWILTDACTAAKARLDTSDAKRLLQRRRQRFASKAWGWKDPRTIHFLSQWHELIPQLRTLFVWRPCHEVIDSLLRRSALVSMLAAKLKRPDAGGFQKITEEQAYRLWILSTGQLLDAHRAFRQRSLLVSLSSLLQNDVRIFEQVNTMCANSLTYRPLRFLFRSELLTKTHDGPRSKTDEPRYLHFSERREVVSLTEQLQEESWC